MEGKKQTAIEWLAEQIHKYGIVNEACIEQAKQMEKQKLEQFYNHGQWAIIDHGHGDTFEDYYNKTYEK
jgi:mannitol/fructose-specific phosphotransferase system IIA component